MKKRYLIIVTILMLFVFTGCTNGKKDGSGGDLVINDVSFTLDSTATFNDINFKYDSRFKLRNDLQIASLEYVFESGPFFSVDLSISAVSSMDRVISVYETKFNSSSTLSISGKTWYKFEGVIDETSVNQIVYIVEHNDSIYMIRFLKAQGIEEFAKEFLMNVTFNAKADDSSK